MGSMGWKGRNLDGLSSRHTVREQLFLLVLLHYQVFNLPGWILVQRRLCLAMPGREGRPRRRRGRNLEVEVSSEPRGLPSIYLLEATKETRARGFLPQREYTLSS